MKKNQWLNIQNSHCFKLLLLFTITLSLSFSSNAQTPALNPDLYLDIHNHCHPCSADISVVNAISVNCDMHDQVGDKIIGVAYTVYDGEVRYVNHPLYGTCAFYTNVPELISGLFLDFPGMNHQDRDLCIPDAEKPDVVIGNDNATGHGSASGDFIAAAVFNSISQPSDVMMTTWQLSNFVVGAVPTPSASVAFAPFALNDQSNGRKARDPHIDLFAYKADPTLYTAGPHSLDRFIATWTEFDPNTNQNYIMVAVGDLINPTAFSRYQIPLFKNSEGVSPDVATQIVFDGPDIWEKAYVTYLDPVAGNAIRLAELDFNGNVLLSTTNISLANPTANVDVNPPRIEAQAYYNLRARPEAKWDVVVSAIPTGGTNYEIQSYNDITTGKQVIATSSTEDHFSATVTGVGEHIDGSASGRVGEVNFSTAYYTTDLTLSTPGNGDIYANSIDMTTGLPSSTYYEVNFSDLGQSSTYTTANEIPVAVSSSSNTGDDLLVVWYNGFNTTTTPNWGSFNYKLAGNTYAFKPTAANTLTKNNTIKIYPNPTTNKLSVDGANNATYSITDVVGRHIASGKINSGNYTINTSSYTTGMYILSITNDGKTKKVKFIKD